MSTPLKMFASHILGEDKTLTTFLKGALWLEVSLQETLDHALERPEALDRKQRLQFSTKIAFCDALGVISTEEAKLYRKIATIRNNFAHRHDYEITFQTIAEIENLLTGDLRRDYDASKAEFEGRIESPHDLLVLFFTHLIAEMRSKNAARRYQRENAGKLEAYSLLRMAIKDKSDEELKTMIGLPDYPDYKEVF